MKISLNELKKYVDIKIKTPELLKLIGSRLVEIEGSLDLSEKYNNIYIVKVAECEKIEGTHLSLCKIDAGKNDLIQVVCGAPNVHRGMLAVWIAPGAIVPSTFGNENFELGVRKLRGFESSGMLAAADELDLWSGHDGIVEIDPKDARPGDVFAEVFELNDTILDIENKSLTHRPDCFGLIGFAREIAGILGQEFKNPDFISKKIITTKNSDLKIEILDTEVCPRYSCAVVSSADLSEPTKYLKKSDIFLAKAGMRPVSPIVDLTNILMLETGQPLHAFDYDKFIAIGKSKTPKIIVRLAKQDEELQLLDGKTIKCAPTDILITSNNIPVALAGAMGGLNTAIDASTKKIILESATFSLYNLRKTQMAHGIFSEAITRFTKGQPADQTMSVLGEIIRRLDVSAEIVADCYKNPVKINIVRISSKEINNLLGSNYSAEKIIKTLENVGFEIYAPELNHAPHISLAKFDDLKKGEMAIVVPAWRTDIAIKEDIIEEVGRLLGYDNLPISFPTRNFVESKIDNMFALKTRLRNILSDKLGCNEALTYSFVSADLLEKVNEDVENSYKIVNSISPELQRFRQTIVPSLLDKIRENEKAGHTNFSLYELNQISEKSFGLNDEKVPVVKTHLGLITYGNFYRIKSLVVALMHELKLDFEISSLEKHPYFEPLHSAVILLDKKPVAYFGELKSSVLKQFKLKNQLSALEFDLSSLIEEKGAKKVAPTFSKFPFVSRDLTLKTKVETKYSELETLILKILAEKSLVYKLSPVSIYQSEKDSASKNISFHISFSDKNKTLTSEEISAIIEEISTKLSKTLGAEVV